MDVVAVVSSLYAVIRTVAMNVLSDDVKSLLFMHVFMTAWISFWLELVSLVS